MSEVLELTGVIATGTDTEESRVWVVDGVVTFEPPAAGTTVTTLNGYVLPGLVDAHCHVGLDAHGAVGEAESEAQARADRDSGALLLRDAGSPADTRWIDNRDDLPKIIRAGRHIARPKRYIRNYADEIEPGDLTAYMVRAAQYGDGWVKLVGDWIDRERGDLAPLWPREALSEGIAAAHAHGARVTAHCFAEESLEDLVAAGIDCIEHATGLTVAHLEMFAQRGVAIVPTLVNIATFPDIAAPAREKFPAYYRRMIDLWERRYDTIAAAHEAGVPIYCGTDAGGSIAHGLVPAEVVELTKAGMSAKAALDAACWGAREWLGRPGLSEGADADLVVYASDPRVDVRVLADPKHVVLRGVTV